MRIIDDAELFEKIPDDVGSCRVALNVQHFDGVAREVERGQSPERKLSGLKKDLRRVVLARLGVLLTI